MAEKLPRNSLNSLKREFSGIFHLKISKVHIIFPVELVDHWYVYTVPKVTQLYLCLEIFRSLALQSRSVLRTSYSNPNVGCTLKPFFRSLAFQSGSIRTLYSNPNVGWTLKPFCRFYIKYPQVVGRRIFFF